MQLVGLAGCCHLEDLLDPLPNRLRVLLEESSSDELLWRPTFALPFERFVVEATHAPKCWNSAAR